jgi:hypothetical protein
MDVEEVYRMLLSHGVRQEDAEKIRGNNSIVCINISMCITIHAM